MTCLYPPSPLCVVAFCPFPFLLAALRSLVQPRLGPMNALPKQVWVGHRARKGVGVPLGRGVLRSQVHAGRQSMQRCEASAVPNSPFLRAPPPHSCKAAALPSFLPPGGCIDQALSFLCYCIQHAIAFCLKESGNKPPVVTYPSARVLARSPAPPCHLLGGLLFLNFWMFLLQWGAPILSRVLPACLWLQEGSLLDTLRGGGFPHVHSNQQLPSVAIYLLDYLPHLPPQWRPRAA